MKKQFLILVFLLGFLSIVLAEKAPIIYGKINKADLLNNVFTSDTSAPAVIICDYGYFSDTQYRTVRILRIKILKKEGLVWANQSFNLDYKTDIRGITYNLEGNDIVETKLKNESIFKTRITENYYQMRVAMPNVKVGSIIDIQFMFEGIPSSWDFQQEIPVVHSELIIEPSNYVKYHKNYFGYIPLSVNTNIRWVIEDAPAFKSEPFMTSSKNYRTRFEFDIEEITRPGTTRTYTNNGITYQRETQGYYQSFTKSWDNIRDLLYYKKSIDSWGFLAYLCDHFGSALEADSYLNEAAKEIKSRSLSQDELIKAAFEYTKQIKWDNTSRFLTEKIFLSNVYKEGKGNSADINIALIQLLLKLGLDAGPVVMSTRSNGQLSEQHPSLNKLNYVIAAVFTENDTILLDATEEHCPYYLLPMRDLNGKGQYMDKKRTGWVSLEAKKRDKQMVVYTLSLQEDENMKGKISYFKGDYAALDFRNEYDKFNSDDEYLNSYKEGKKGLKIITHKIANLDSIYKPVNEEFEVTINNAVNDIDGELYFTPMLYEQLKENPFRISDRSYPIDFGYAREKTVIVNFEFPQGYSIVNMPQNISMKLPGNSASFTCTSKVNEGKITVIYKIAINSNIFVQTAYADLREFYNQVIAKEIEPIVLKKI